MFRSWKMLLLLAPVGCTAVGPSNFAAVNPLAYLRPAPTKMVVNVCEAPLEKDSMPVHQGMLCRVHFFHREDAAPIVVNGDVVVTAYDKSKHGDEPTPVGVYNISNAELPGHRRKDIVGESYLFWLPYEPKAKTQMVVVIGFQPLQGQPITSSPVKLELPPAKGQPSSDVAARPDASKFYPQYTVVSRPKRPSGEDASTIPLRPGERAWVATSKTSSPAFPAPPVVARRPAAAQSGQPDAPIPISAEPPPAPQR